MERNGDLISRQAAIEALTEYGNGRAVYIAVEEAVRRIEQLPPAQPYTADIQKIQDLEQAEIEKAFELGREDALSEIVRCKDCKHYNAGFECLVEGYGIERNKDWFCADAERREE